MPPELTGASPVAPETSATLTHLAWIAWAVVYTLVGGIVGLALILVSCAIVPRVVNKLTPHIDEEKEIVRGNRAVAEYFGRIVAAGIIGVSLIVAAAVLGGIMAALH
jgi:hypothetical protein